MSSLRGQRLGEISAALGSRNLIWFGIRGQDAGMLEALPQLHASVSITAPLTLSSLAASVTIEEISGRRVDLDAYDIDQDASNEAGELTRHLIALMSQPSVLLSYRPCELVSSLGLALRSSCDVLGMTKDQQRTFEYKPWVETALEARGVETLGWRYLLRERRDRMTPDFGKHGLVLRASRSSGGVGVNLARNADDLGAAWDEDRSPLLGAAPYLTDALPLNVGGIVYADGTVHLHPASLQIIGVPGLTDRPFGYCGNDFAAAAELDGAVLDEVDRLVREVGAWLAHERYLGAFGVDLLIWEGHPRFVEVNARLQGSSRLSAELAARAELPDLLTEHLAAVMHVAPPADAISLRSWAARVDPAAQVVFHALNEAPASPGSRSLRPTARRLLDPPAGVELDVGAVRFVEEHRHVVTTDGYTLLPSLLEGDEPSP